jgi:hypothetical protein
MINISTEFENYNYSFNRSLSSIIDLPYQLKDVELGVNELANGFNFNKSLDFLQSNLMYLYSVSKFANPDLPKNYKGWLGSSENNNLGKVMFVYLKGNFFRSGLKFDSDGNVIASLIPYFYLTNYDGTTINIIFTYNNVYNPEVDFLPVGVNYIIDLSGEYNGDDLSSKRVVEILTEQNLIASYNESKFELTFSTRENGGTFFGNRSTDTYTHLFGDNIVCTVIQGDNPIVFTNNSTSPSLVKNNPSNFDQANNLSLSRANLPGFKNIFLCSDTRIQSLSSNTTTNEFVFAGYTDTYGENNKLNFLKINGSAVYQDSLYISDESRNNVVRLNISGFTTHDDHRNNKYYETEIIGGEGEVRSNYSFDKPKILDFYKNNLYVLDQGNECIKVYDKDLGFVKNLRKAATYKIYPPVAIKIYNDNFYWLTANGTLLVFDFDLNLLRQKDISVNDTDEFLDLIISPINNNFYALTRKNIYKYFTDTEVIIGKFNLANYNINGSNISYKFFNLIETIDNKDVIYAYSNNNGRGVIFVFEEDEFYFNLLSDYNFQIFSKDELHLKKEEFASSFAYNKSINKILKNTLQLRNFIYRKINSKLLRDESFEFTGVTYFSEDDLNITGYQTSMNNYIGTNEIFSRAVVNRVLGEVYKLQSLLLKLFQSNVEQPPRQTIYLASDNNGIMLETWPSIIQSHFVLEDSQDDNDFLIQEFAVISETVN